MKKRDIGFSMEVYSSINELPEKDAALLHRAKEVTKMAYAPYSNFQVSAVALLNNGETVIGTNQENASYPVAICAERVLLSSAATLFPGVGVNTMAISYDNLKGESKNPISPCGVCRQTLSEYEDRTHQPIRLILGGLSGEVYVIENAKQLLPLSFTAEDLKQ